jgi:hypothetical protein
VAPQVIAGSQRLFGEDHRPRATGVDKGRCAEPHATAVREQQANAMDPAGVQGGQPVKRCAQRGKIAGEAEGPRGGPQPFEVQGKQRVHAVREAQRFDEFEPRIEAADKRRLEQTLGVLGVRLGIDDDAAAHAEAHSPVVLRDQRADGDVEAAVAVRRDPPQGTGV